MEQLHFIKQSAHESFEVGKNVSRPLGEIHYLKQENKTKTSIIQSLIQSGNTNNYDNGNSYSKSSNYDENKNSGIENDAVNIHILNDDSNITMRRCKNKKKSSKDIGIYINDKDKSSNKIESKNDNNKIKIKNKYNKSSWSSRYYYYY